MSKNAHILDTLSTRERDVFTLITDGHTNKVIAFKLGISDKTVEVHRARIMKKTGSRGLADLITIRRQVDAHP